jgi:hypothetical protein
MKLSAREIEQFEDAYVLCVVKGQGPEGAEAAKRYCRQLSQKSAAALTAGYIEDAIWFAEREYELTARYFGLSHAYSQMALFMLEKLRQHQQMLAESAEFELSGCRNKFESSAPAH